MEKISRREIGTGKQGQKKCKKRETGEEIRHPMEIGVIMNTENDGMTRVLKGLLKNKR